MCGQGQFAILRQAIRGGNIFENDSIKICGQGSPGKVPEQANVVVVHSQGAVIGRHGLPARAPGPDTGIGTGADSTMKCARIRHCTERKSTPAWAHVRHRRARTPLPGDTCAASASPLGSKAQKSTREESGPLRGSTVQHQPRRERAAHARRGPVRVLRTVPRREIGCRSTSSKASSSLRV